MKKFLRIIFIVPIYIILVVLSNFRKLFNNAISNENILNNISFINLSIVILLLMVIFYIIFREKLKFCKKIYLPTIMISFFIILLDGIFVDKYIANYIILFIYLVFVGLIASIFTKQRFEISLYISVSMGLIVATFLAMFNILFIFKYLLIALIPIGVYIVLKNKEKIGEIFDKKFNSYTFAIFSIFFILMLVGGINRYVHVWDEYSHWAFDAKSVIKYEKLSTCAEVVSSTRAYPPIMSLWHYFVSLFVGYSEQNLYIGLSIFILIGLMPAFAFINKKNKHILPLFTLSIIFGAGIFGSLYKYSSLYADYISGVLYFVNFVIYILYKSDNKRLMKYLFISLTMTIWIKPTGIIPAFAFFVIIMCKELLELNNYRVTLRGFSRILKKWYKLGLAVAGMFFIWNIYVKICELIIPKFYDKKVLSGMLKTGLNSDKLSFSVLKKTVISLFNAFNETIVYGINKISLFQMLIIAGSLFIIYVYIKYRKGFVYSIKKCLPLFWGYLVFFILTMLSIFVMFSSYEAQELASFSRYLNTFHIAVFLLINVFLIKDDFILKEKNKLFAVCMLLFFILNLSFNDITFFVSDYSERIKTRNISYERQAKIQKLVDNTSEDSLIYVIEQKDQDGIMAMWYTRFYAFPRRVNSYQSSINWKIKTEINGDDLGDWGLTAQELSEDLYNFNFDYLYLYSADEYFFKEISFMLDDVEDVTQYTLFKVEKHDNKTVSLLPIA